MKNHCLFGFLIKFINFVFYPFVYGGWLVLQWVLKLGWVFVCFFSVELPLEISVEIPIMWPGFVTGARARSLIVAMPPFVTMMVFFHYFLTLLLVLSFGSFLFFGWWFLHIGIWIIIILYIVCLVFLGETTCWVVFVMKIEKTEIHTQLNSIRLFGFVELSLILSFCINWRVWKCMLFVAFLVDLSGFGVVYMCRWSVDWFAFAHWLVCVY